MDTMKLLTKSLEKALPALYSQDGKGDEAIVHVKFFSPGGAATWFATEYDPESRIFFGYADLFGQGPAGGAELGNFSLDEMESVRLPMGLKIERDIRFTPCTLAEAKAAHYNR